MADDDKFMRTAFTRVLHVDGHHVIEARNGREALEKMATFPFNRPDAIILDYMMPDLNGLEVLQKIRQYDHLIPIIIITAYLDFKVAFLSGKYQATYFMPKPPEFNALLLMLKSFQPINIATANREI